MARPEDVVVGSRWRWSESTIEVTSLFRGSSFVITEVSQDPAFGPPRAKYTYDGMKSTGGGRFVSTIAANAERLPPLKCAPGCTPLHACWQPCCPGHREPCYLPPVLLTGALLDFPPPAREHGGPAPMRSGSGALMCDWILRRR